METKKRYDVGAFIWPSYSGDDPRTRLFWPDGIGEWESVISAEPKFPGHQWPRKPSWGYVNEGDRYVMEMQINAALDHGVNLFIYDWYWFDNRPFLENCLNDGFLKARNNEQMKFYLMWANHNVNYIWDKRNSDRNLRESIEASRDDLVFTGSVSREQFETVAHRLITKYFSRPNYYRIDGKPVFMIYCLPILVEGLGGLAQTKDALLWFRRECEKAGLGGLHLQFDLEWFCCNLHDGDRLLPVEEMIDYFEFDSMTNYQMKNMADSMDHDYAEIARQAEQAWYKVGKQYRIPYFPQVAVGWDNNPRFHATKPIIPGSTPERFREALENSKKYVDSFPAQPPLITINSWNEWTEGSYLQPDDLNGYAWLEAVRSVFGSARSEDGSV